MTPFDYSRAGDVAEALRLGGAAQAKFLGGGTNLIDLMRETLERPSALVDITGLPAEITERDDGGLLIGSAVRGRRSALRARRTHLVIRQRMGRAPAACTSSPIGA